MSELVLFYLGDEGRSGAYEGDVTFEYIEELWEFVNAPVTDEVTDSLFIGTIRQDPAADDAGIIIHLEHLAIRHFILLHELCLTFLRIHIHAAEFIEAELFAILAHPDLGEKYRSRRLDIDCRCQEYTQDTGQDTSDQPSCDIQTALHEQLSGRGIIHRSRYYRHISQLFHDDLPSGFCQCIGDPHVRYRTHFQELSDQRFSGCISRFQVYVNLVHPAGTGIFNDVISIRYHRIVSDLLSHHIRIYDCDAQDLVRSIGLSLQLLCQNRQTVCFGHNDQRTFWCIPVMMLQVCLPEDPSYIAQDPVEYHRQI
ncbi:unknown [Firmicutes bacterium CAG:65]|nr:unknown [Firmicutes bacterium CAG:65]